MSRISDLGEACDQGIKTLKTLMEGDDAMDSTTDRLRLDAAQVAIHAYFGYSGAGPLVTPDDKPAD